jgi:hypothetical protein
MLQRNEAVANSIVVVYINIGSALADPKHKRQNRKTRLAAVQNTKRRNTGQKGARL